MIDDVYLPELEGVLRQQITHVQALNVLASAYPFYKYVLPPLPNMFILTGC